MPLTVADMRVYTCFFAAVLPKPNWSLKDVVPAFRYSMASASVLVMLVLASCGAHAAGAFGAWGLQVVGCSVSSAQSHALQCLHAYFKSSDLRQGKQPHMSLLTHLVSLHLSGEAEFR